LFLLADGSGPLKSIEIRSNGCKAFIIGSPAGMPKHGLTSAQTLQLLQTCLHPAKQTVSSFVSHNDEAVGCPDDIVFHATSAKTATAELMRKYFWLGNQLRHLVCLADILRGIAVRPFLVANFQSYYSLLWSLAAYSS